MIFGANHLLNIDRFSDHSSVSSYVIDAPERLSLKMRNLVTSKLLVAYGIVANALFWGGLLTPFHANAGPEITYLHGFIALLGLTLAIGGAVATMMTVSRKGSVSLQSLEFAAWFFNFFVLTATGALLVSAFIRGI
jgi:hypothetical protein